MTRALRAFAASIHDCRRCQRLVEHREHVALKKRKAYLNESYWGRPIAGFGDAQAPLLVVGLAPGAHGANRTGRVFTGDSSGDFLYAALFRAGLASQARSEHRDDGLVLRNVFITLPVRCVPPDNHPTPDEVERCIQLFTEEVALLPRLKVALVLGSIAWTAALRLAARPGPGFTHGARATVRWGRRPVELCASYHVSQQNTQTGRLTQPMFDRVLGEAKALAGL